MSRQKYRGNVLSANFPLLSSFSGKSVILEQIDQYYVRPNAFSGTLANEKLGIPQVVFMENIMPVANGLKSIGFQPAIPASSDSHDFDNAFWLRDAEENRTLFVPAHGKNYIYDKDAGAWTSAPIFVSRDAEVSVANIKGRTFVCYSKHVTLFEWKAGALVPVIFTGISANKVMGIVSAGAYLIVYTEDTIYWSSILVPTDFIPSLATTAGSSKVLSLKGKIQCAAQLSDGFLIYTTFNAIAATYTGNPSFPWNFKEIAGSPGIDEKTEITLGNNAPAQYANTQSGLVKLDKTQAVLVWPEITEFLNCRRIETYDYAKKSIVEKDLLAPLIYKLAYIADRFLVISYGYFILNFALIYDLALNRWGKIRIDHVCCFDYIGHPAVQDDETNALRYVDLDPRTYEQLFETYEELGGIYIPGDVGAEQRPYKSLAFLKDDGEVVLVDFDLPHKDQNAVLYLGKYQLVRNRFMDLYEVSAERMSTDPQTELAILSSLDGTTIDKTTYPMKDRKTSGLQNQTWLVNLSAHSYILRFEKRLDLTTLELVFDQAGYR